MKRVSICIRVLDMLELKCVRFFQIKLICRQWSVLFYSKDQILYIAYNSSSEYVFKYKNKTVRSL